MTRIPSAADRETDAGVPQWSLANPRWVDRRPPEPPAIRVIVDNDFAGDPDDLFQIVHQLLSPSVEIRAIVCSHDQEGDGRDSASEALLVARDVFRRMGLTDTHLLHEGSNLPLADRHTPRPSPGVDAILAEARRDDDRPLFFAAGAGFTDLASAYLIDPSIVERVTVVWIGGVQHDEIAGTPLRHDFEYNRDLDRSAAQLVFAAGFEIWQVPRDLYRRCILAESEMRVRVRDEGGPVGAYMYDEIRHVLDQLSPRIGPVEMYPMGDQPLVALTVLHGGQLDDDDFVSHRYVVKPTPEITDAGTYRDNPHGRPMRVYTDLDFRLMFEDFYLKLREFAQWQRREGGD